ncbi:PLDc N-terminal domain-containing protein [Corynebacterium sp. sy039]|uniref:PLDc N-terminal domain-containing protein n=1 Tax=Corynebacterium sp. sy039 TaxID=2599641 RepID=UPI0011B5640C|nr:PLDc N-terminal domain-containing protein [Corynebacterium sp. sy039]QDZ42167.1 hypothetical protein FQV43_02495 [Corynebacterium sp. sy039]
MLNLILAAISFIILIVIPIIALLSLLRKQLTTSETALWAIVILIAPLMGPVAFFMWDGANKSTQ